MGDFISRGFDTFADVGLILLAIGLGDKIMGWKTDPTFIVFIIATVALFETKRPHNAR